MNHDYYLSLTTTNNNMASLSHLPRGWEGGESVDLSVPIYIYSTNTTILKCDSVKKSLPLSPSNHHQHFSPHIEQTTHCFTPFPLSKTYSSFFQTISNRSHSKITPPNQQIHTQTNISISITHIYSS